MRFDPQKWLQSSDRIMMCPEAAHHILAKYSPSEQARARRTIACAAGFNTPLWQGAVMAVNGPIRARTARIHLDNLADELQPDLFSPPSTLPQEGGA